MGSSPYQFPSNINHAMLSAEAAAAAGAYQSMFPGGKAWFQDHEHYGEFVLHLYIDCVGCGVVACVVNLGVPTLATPMIADYNKPN